MKKIAGNIRMFLWMTVLTGILYPLLITGIAQLTMKKNANGDFLSVKNKIVGAALIAQKFESDRFFWPRPSAIDYNPLPSGGSNLGPISPVLKRAVDDRQDKILKSQHVKKNQIPPELLFASGSGLDPHISVSAAFFQIERIAKARGIDSKDIKDIVDRLTITREWGFLGQPRLNVLKLNIALEELQATKKQEK